MRKHSYTISIIVIVLMLIFIGGCSGTTRSPEFDMVNEYFVSIGIPASEGDVLQHLEKRRYINTETNTIRTERELLLAYIEHDKNGNADLLNFHFEFITGQAAIYFKSEIWEYLDWSA